MQRRSFMKLAASSAASIGIASALSACKIKGGGSNSISPTLRFINLANNTPFGVYITTANTTNVVTTNYGTVAFGTATAHQSIAWEGQYSIQLQNATGNTLTTIIVSLQQNTPYTIVVYSAAGTLHYQILNDTQLTGISSGDFVINTLSTITGASTAPAYDLYLEALTSGVTPTATGVSSDLTPLSADVTASSVGVVSGYSAQKATGSYRMRLVQSGPGAGVAKNLMFDFPSVDLKTNQGLYTLLIYTQGSATLPTVMLLNPDGTTQILSNPLARVRVVQGSPNIVSSQVAIGTNAVGGLSFASSSNYYTVVASSISAAFTDTSSASASPTPYLTYSSTSLSGGQDYSIYSVGDSSKTKATAFVVQDQNLPCNTSGDAGLYFVNAVPTGDVDTASGQSTTSVDVLVAHAQLATSIQAQAAPAAASQVDVQPNQGPVVFSVAGHPALTLGPTITTATTTTVTIGGVQQTLSVPALISGGIYTIALVGANGTYAPVVYQTNQF